MDHKNHFLRGLLTGCLCVLMPATGWGGGFSISSQTNAPDDSNPSARAMALGSAFTGVADDASALFANPAGLAWLPQGEVSANSNFWLVDTFQETALVGLPLPGLGGIGLAGSYLGFGSIEGRDASGSLTSNYTASQLFLAGGGGAEILKSLAAGAGLQGYESSLAGSSYWDLAFNLGLLYRPLPGLRAGAALDSLGVNPSSGLSGTAFRLGASYETALSGRDRLLAAAETSLNPGTIDYLQAGLEYGFSRTLFLRAGWQAPLGDNGIGGLTGLTAGLGLAFAGLKLDYAYLPYGDLGSAHRVSLGYAFGSPREEDSTSSNGASQTVPGKGLAHAPPTASAPPLSPLIFPNGEAPPLPAQAGGTKGPRGPAPTTGPGTGAANLPAQAALPGTALPASPGSAAPRPADDTGTGVKNPLDVEFDFNSDAAAQGQQLEKEGKYREAAQTYRQAIQQNPQDVSAWKALGSLYFRFRQKEPAVKCFEEVLKLEPDNQKLADWLEKYKASYP